MGGGGDTAWRVRSVAGVHHTGAMTVRLSVSLPDTVHADLLRLAAASNISAAAVIRAVLSDVVPRMTNVIEYMGTITPEEVGPLVEKVDAWAGDLATLLHDAPDPFGEFRNVLDDDPEGGGDE